MRWLPTLVLVPNTSVKYETGKYRKVNVVQPDLLNQFIFIASILPQLCIVRYNRSGEKYYLSKGYKLHKKIIKKTLQIAQKEALPIRQSYTRVLKKLSVDQRFRNHPKNKSKARKADKKVKTIAGRLVRELERNLSPDSTHQKTILFFKQVLAQTRGSKNKI